MIRIGTSGWSYDHWADVLYPPKLPVAKRLARYTEEFDTVELNASFYRWPKDATFSGWRDCGCVGHRTFRLGPRTSKHNKHNKQAEQATEAGRWQAKR